MRTMLHLVFLTFLAALLTRLWLSGVKFLVRLTMLLGGGQA